MMDILLINTPVSRKRHDPKSTESVPPLGLGYIYTELTRSGYSCKFIDAVLDSRLPQEVQEIINMSGSDYIGLNVFSSNLDIVRDLVQNAKPPKKFIVGGPAARALVSEIRNWKPSGSLTVVIGEAELVLPHVIDQLGKRQPNGSTFDVVDVTPDSDFFPINIDLPLDRSIFKNEPIMRDDLGLTECHIVTSRGCIYDCAYCTAARSCNVGIKPRFRTLDNLIEELNIIRKMHPETSCVRMLDDLFLRNKASIELAKSLFPGNNLYWRCMAHINTFKELSSKLLSNIKESGCRELFIGIESGNDEMLKHVRKPFSRETAYKTVCRIIDANIAVKCYFILGFPGETRAAAQDTISLASKLKEYADIKKVQLRISPFRFRPYHGTDLYDELLNRGWTLEQIKNRNDVLDTEEFNPYDCISGHYAEYDNKSLDAFKKQMDALNT